MMGSFEKLGILVIVVIIVMILAVAVYQWGANGTETGITTFSPLSERAEALIVDYDKPVREAPEENKADKPVDTARTAEAGAEWAGGIPKSYVIQNRDIVWKLVVQRWRLKDSFIAAIKQANPTLNMKRLRAGDRLVIPNPEGFMRAAKSSDKAGQSARSRSYKIQEGDLLSTIARNHLGKASRWPEIQKLNPQIDPAHLTLGDTIRLPVK